MSESPLFLILLALTSGVVALLVFRASPRLTMLAWAFSVFFVPIWVGVSIGVMWSAVTLMTLAAIAVSLSDIRLGAVDLLVALFAALVFVQLALALTSLSAAVTAILEWLVPYVWGRLALARLGAIDVTRIIAVAATIAAALALVEFASGTNIFVLLPAAGKAEWTGLQVRGNFIRTEGAFGHSIALGGSLAMSAPFVLVSRWRPLVTAAALALITGAVVVTLSRIGLVTLAITLVLTIVLLPGVRKSVRWLVVLGGAAAVALVVPFLGAVFDDASDEAGGSASYRSDLFALTSQIRMFANAGNWTGRLLDGVYYGKYADSVDNTFLLVGLRFGWVLLEIFALILILIALSVLGSPNPASIAIAGQLPGLIAVALITQYGSLLWFIAGLAVAWRFQRQGEDGVVPVDPNQRLTVEPRRPKLSSPTTSSVA